MTLPERSQSYWIASTPETSYEALEGDLAVDVAVLGGGIVGVTAAYLLKQHGLRVALVEARRIVTGVTGHTTAKLTSLHGLKYSQIVSQFDRERARLYADANEGAIRFVAAVVQERGIDCDLHRMPAFTYTREADELDRIHAEVEAAREAGLEASFVTETTLPYEVAGAVRVENQAIFHPRKYLLGLARLVDGDGSRMFEHTTARDVREGRPCVVTTDHGRIRADHVIVATHYPFLDRGLYFARLEPMRSYALGIRVAEPPPQGMFISTGEDFQSVRPHPENGGWLVIVGGVQHMTGRSSVPTMQHYRAVEAFAREALTVESIDYRWSTQDNRTIDGIPYVGTYTPASPHLFTATGFDGWGMSNGTAAAMILADLILKRHNRWAAAYDPARVGQLTKVGQMLRYGASNVDHLVRDRISQAAPLEVSDLAPGEGRVGKVGGETLAVSRAADGTLHAVAPACAHQGCLVTWNEAEQSWDCPCHGSRYAADGTLLHGPATKGLERRPLVE